MTLTLTLTPELEHWLTDEAQQQGVSVQEYTVQFLEKHLPAKNRRGELVALLQSWIDADNEEEQKETGD